MIDHEAEHIQLGDDELAERYSDWKFLGATAVLIAVVCALAVWVAG